MPFCPDRGTEVSEDTRFCPECGKPLIKPQSELPTNSESQEETEATEMEILQAEMKRDIRSWGFGLLVIGVIHIVFSEFLDPIWGGIIIAIGISCLFIRRRGMYIVIGIALMLVGIMNILFTGFGGWTIFGVFQIGFGIHQVRKFWKYDGRRLVRTQSEQPSTSALYVEASLGKQKMKKRLLIVLSAVVVIVLIVVFVIIPSQEVEPEPAIPAYFTTYTDELGLFSISYPPEWELGLEYLEDISVEEAQYLFMAGLPVGGSYAASINIVVGQCPVTICTHDLMVKAEIEGMKAADPGYRELSRVKTTVDGRTATILVSQGTVAYTSISHYDVHYVQVFLLAGRTEWVVTCATLSDEYSKWEDDFDAIVRSLRIFT